MPKEKEFSSTLKNFFNPTLIPIKVDYIAFTEKGRLHQVDEFGKIITKVEHADIITSFSREAPNNLKEKLGFSVVIKELVVKKKRTIVNYLKKHNFPYQEKNKGEITISFWVFAVLCCQKNINMKILRVI